MTYVVYYTTFVVYKKIFGGDLEAKTYAQNSGIIFTFRIQKNFFEIPIGKKIPKIVFILSHLYTTKVVEYTTYVVSYATHVVSYTTFVVYKKSK